MTSPDQFALVKADLENDLNGDHYRNSVEVTNIQEVFVHDDLTIYQVTQKVTSKETDEVLDAEDYPDLFAWHMDFWKEPGLVLLCGNIHTGIRSLDARCMGIFRGAIPDGDAALKPPWSDISRNIDKECPISILLEEVAEYLNCNEFDVHYKALVHVQKLLALGDKNLEDIEEEKYEELAGD